MAKKSPDNPWASPNGKRPPQMPPFSPEMGNYPQKTAETTRKQHKRALMEAARKPRGRSPTSAPAAQPASC
jgi:hypothetical protein